MSSTRDIPTAPRISAPPWTDPAALSWRLAPSHAATAAAMTLFAADVPTTLPPSPGLAHLQIACPWGQSPRSHGLTSISRHHQASLVRQRRVLPLDIQGDLTSTPLPPRRPQSGGGVEGVNRMVAGPCLATPERPTYKITLREGRPVGGSRGARTSGSTPSRLRKSSASKRSHSLSPYRTAVASY